MSLTEDLLAIERRLWTGGADAYHRHMDEDCLVAFTEMAGVYGRDEIADSVEGGPRWVDPVIAAEGLVQPTDDTAILTYRARARRGEDERYHALVSSGYVRRAGAWKMVFHQQTPLET